MAVTNNKTKDDRETEVNSNLFGAMYYNLISGIKSFQDTFGLVDREDYLQEGINGPIVKFTGSSKDNTNSLKNIWNGFKVNNNQYISALNNSLSLRHSELTKYKDRLLENGYQKQFNWSFENEPENGNGTVYTYFGVTDKGVIIDNYSYSGDEKLYINFYQNFINVNFVISGIWKNKKSVIIEKVNID
ncbi:hypothetical protein [Spiroplasma taiwanense]|uniref:Uncharacterized protein n=1 Tax=Spiroplasma taiwanense CT-1 TaxID=1276220 RepID=S5LX33_9MOLU|nr:hypothetical protein [Spiroplasma taiwanense]AGR41181.1 hypothetical protein STAIW_v1c05590 [Spiroplasma taiwanense CT-1]